MISYNGPELTTGIEFNTEHCFQAAQEEVRYLSFCMFSKCVTFYCAPPVFPHIHVRFGIQAVKLLLVLICAILDIFQVVEMVK